MDIVHGSGTFVKLIRSTTLLHLKLVAMATVYLKYID